MRGEIVVERRNVNFDFTSRHDDPADHFRHPWKVLHHLRHIGGDAVPVRGMAMSKSQQKSN